MALVAAPAEPPQNPRPFDRLLRLVELTDLYERGIEEDGEGSSIDELVNEFHDVQRALLEAAAELRRRAMRLRRSSGTTVGEAAVRACLEEAEYFEHHAEVLVREHGRRALSYPK